MAFGSAAHRVRFLPIETVREQTCVAPLQGSSPACSGVAIKATVFGNAEFNPVGKAS